MKVTSSPMVHDQENVLYLNFSQFRKVKLVLAVASLLFQKSHTSTQNFILTLQTNMKKSKVKSLLGTYY